MYSAPLVQIDAAGGTLVAGGFNGALSFGDETLTSSGEQDIFVARLDAWGAHDWSRQFGGDGTQSVATMALGANGDIVLAGPFKGALDFGGGPLSGKTFVAKLDSKGNPLWSKGYVAAGGLGTIALRSVAIDPAGSIVLAGSFNGTIDLGGDPSASSGTDIFIAKLGSSGELHWVKTLAARTTRS